VVRVCRREEHGLTLTEERAVVHKETVPIERVRLGAETVTEQQQVDETVRKEQIETEGIDPGPRHPNEN
jgi:stress response protein YsnF